MIFFLEIPYAYIVCPNISVRRSQLIVLTSILITLPLHQPICQHVARIMITQLQLARAMDGICAIAGSETKGGLTP